MDASSQNRVVAVERISKEIVTIEFADGKAALYSGELLRQMLPQAEVLSDDATSDNE
jgi:hypothetical protein